MKWTFCFPGSQSLVAIAESVLVETLKTLTMQDKDLVRLEGAIYPHEENIKCRYLEVT